MIRKKTRTGQLAAIALASLMAGQTGTSVALASELSKDDNPKKTETPIERIVVIIGENRTFDNIYGTYVPEHGTVWNLLSRGIVNNDGSPGINKDAAKQFQIGNIDPVKYFISTTNLNMPNKAAYSPFLPTPEAGGAPPLPVTKKQLQKDPVDSAPPFDAQTFSQSDLHTISPVLRLQDLHLLTSGATGLSNCTVDPTEPPSPCAEPDTRIT